MYSFLLKMKRIISLGAAMLVASFFIVIEAQTLPSPYSVENGKVIIAQADKVISDAPIDRLYFKTLLWFIERQQISEETQLPLVEIGRDFDNHRVEVAIQFQNKDNQLIYKCLLSVKLAENSISILASKITAESTVNVIKLVKRTSFDKLQPDKKPKHKEYLDEFSSLYQEYVQQMMGYINSHPMPIVNHMADMINGRLVKRMTKEECTLTMMRMPRSCQLQGETLKLMFDSSTYVFIENGVVTNIIR